MIFDQFHNFCALVTNLQAESASSWNYINGMWCNFNGSDCCNSKFISILFYNFRNLVDESSRSNECIFSVSHRSTSCMICLACYSHIISVHTCNR